MKTEANPGMYLIDIMSKNLSTCTTEPSDLSQVRPVAFAGDPDQPDRLATHLKGV